MLKLLMNNPTPHPNLPPAPRGEGTRPVVVTLGEPAGVGPDLVIQLAHYAFKKPLLVIADPDLLKERAEQLNLTLPSSLTLIPLPLAKKTRPGFPEIANAPIILESLNIAVEGCLKKEFSAMVTGPIHKATLNAAGIPFTGHTEYLANLTNSKKTVMMMVSPKFRIALLTTHIPLARVAEKITAENLIATIHILRQELINKFNIAHPRITVCGLNPHAGEEGYLGKEEIEIIIPALKKLQQQGFILKGPLAADTAFIQATLDQSDVILTLYHDQGLPTIKAMDFYQTVNITLGLPLIRTSVDHGSALSLAGSGKTDPRSFIAAIEMACQLI